MPRRKKKRNPKPSPKKPAKKAKLGEASRSSGGGGGTNVGLLEKKARECMERSDWRRALEGYKRLFKIDPEAYGSALVTAGAGYFRECLEQSQAKPAGGVIQILEGVAPGSMLATMRLRLALATKDDDAASSLACALLDEAATEPADVRCAADCLIAIPPERRGDLRWTEPGVIDQALADAAEGNFAAVATAMRGLPRQSPFAHWRLFFKAVCAHADGDSETAGRALSLLDGACSRIARAWIEPDAQSLATAVALRGEAKLAENLPALLRVDGRADYGVVFLRLVDYCRDFPSVAGGIGATLTDYLTTRMSRIDPPEQTLFLLSRKAKEPQVSALAKFVIGRVLIDWLMQTGQVDECDARLVENVVAEGRAALPEHAASTEAHILCEYAVKLMSMGVHCGIGYELSLASQWLERAVKACPDRVVPALALVDCYFLDGRMRQCDAALDSVVKRFPDDLEVLNHAGKVCLQRERYAEGQAFFLALLARDPLSEKARDAVIEAALTNCEALLARKDVKAAAIAADLAYDHSRESSPFIQRPDKIALQCGNLFEFYAGAAAARPYYKRAAEKIPADVFTYERFVVSRLIASQRKSTRKTKRPPTKTFLKDASLTHALDMTDFLVALRPSLSSTDASDCANLLADYVEEAFERDPDWRANVIPLGRKLLANNAPPIVLGVLADAAEKRAPSDAVTLLLETADTADEPAGPGELADLHTARAKLVKEGSTDAVKFCDEVRKRLESTGHYVEDPFDEFEIGDGPDLTPQDIEMALDALFGKGWRGGPKKTPKKKAAKKKAPAKKKAAKKKLPTKKKAAKKKSASNSRSGSKSVALEEFADDPQLELPF